MNYKKKADKAMQEYYRKQDLKCEYCGRPANIKHHFFPKSRASVLRYYELNLISLCQGCHFAHHNGDPRIHVEIIRQRGNKWYNNLLKEKNKIIKPNKKYYLDLIQKYEEGD